MSVLAPPEHPDDPSRALYVALDALRMAAVRCLLRADDRRRDALLIAIEAADAALAADRARRAAALATRT